MATTLVLCDRHRFLSPSDLSSSQSSLSNSPLLAPSLQPTRFFKNDQLPVLLQHNLVLTGFQVHCVEQWVTNTDLPMTSIVVHTGDSSHKIHTCALQFSNTQPSDFLAQIHALVSAFQLTAMDTKFGTIFVTSLASVPSYINVFHVPSGDLARDIPILQFHLSLRRLGCGTRTAISTKPPSDAQLERFIHTFHLVLPRNARFNAQTSRLSPNLKVPADNDSVLASNVALVMEYARLLVELVKLAFVLLAFLPHEFANGDGFVCDRFLDAARLFIASGSDPSFSTITASNSDSSDNVICGPPVVMSAIVKIFVWRTKLSMLVKEVTKDPFTDVLSFQKKIASFQKSKDLPITHTLDSTTVHLIDQALAMSSIGPSRSARMVLSRLKQINTSTSLDNFLFLTLQSDYTRLLWHGTSVSSLRPSGTLGIGTRRTSGPGRPSVPDIRIRGPVGFLDELKHMDEDEDFQSDDSPRIGSTGMSLLQGGREFLASTLRRNVASTVNVKKTRTSRDIGVSMLNPRQRSGTPLDLGIALATAAGIRGDTNPHTQLTVPGSPPRRAEKRRRKPKRPSASTRSGDPVSSSGGSLKAMGLVPLINSNLFASKSPLISSSSSSSSSSSDPSSAGESDPGAVGVIRMPLAFANSILKRRPSVTQIVTTGHSATASPAHAEASLKSADPANSKPRYPSVPNSPARQSPESSRQWPSPFSRGPTYPPKSTPKTTSDVLVSPAADRGIIPGIPALTFFHRLQPSVNTSPDPDHLKVLSVPGSPLPNEPATFSLTASAAHLPKASITEYVGVHVQQQVRARRAISLPRVDCVPGFVVDKVYERRRANSTTVLLQSSWIAMSLVSKKHHAGIGVDVAAVRTRIHASARRLHYLQSNLDDLEKTCQANAQQIDYFKELYQLRGDEIQKYQEQIIDLKSHTANTLTQAENIQTQLSRLQYATSSMTEQLRESEEIVSSMKEGIEILEAGSSAGSNSSVSESVMWKVIMWVPNSLYRIGDGTTEAIAYLIRWIDNTLIPQRLA